MHKNFYGYQKGNVETLYTTGFIRKRWERPHGLNLKDRRKNMRYQTVATFPEYDVIEPYEPVRSPVWEREERNRKKKARRKAKRDAYIMSAMMVLVLVGMIAAWILGIG